MLKLILPVISMALVAMPGSGLVAQEERDFAAVEMAAARAMLARGTAAGAVGIDPTFGANRAPGGAHVAARPESRTLALARALPARAVKFEDARSCPKLGVCTLVGVTRHLVLSEPVFNGDTAQITVTKHEATESTRQPTYYETVRFTLARSRGTWTVVRQEDLGIS